MSEPDPREAKVWQRLMLQGSRSQMPVDMPPAAPEGEPMSESGYSEDVTQPQPDFDRIMRESNAEAGLGYHHGEEQVQELIDAILGRQQGA
jgi:hypothetical protein